MNKNPEILAPAGSIDTLYAAVSMGADAIYVGAPRFGARAFAKNPSVEELTEALTYCHIRGKKVYVTVNTLLTDNELENELTSMLDPLVASGLDAVIVQDPGVLKKIHEAYPTLPIHASTQMALFSGEEANILRPYGVTRLVPARELSIGEIRDMRAATDLEIEVFVHGALCVCYSGWCLMSEHIGGRSGNRGMCAGPCRLMYETGADETGYVLNSKDIMTLAHIPELIDAGIDSFKIEGRMKSKEYSAYLASLYRHYSDVYIADGADKYKELLADKDSVLWRDIKNAMDIYNRGGSFGSFLFKNDETDTISSKVKGHHGLKVGEVTKLNDTARINDRTATIDLSEVVREHDVLAIRDKNGETVYEFTIGAGYEGDRGDKYPARIGNGDVSVHDEVFRTKNATLLSDIRTDIDKALKDSKGISGKWIGITGKPVELSIVGSIPDMQGKLHEVEATVSGAVIEQAAKSPVTSDTVKERLSKLGATGYHFDSLDVSMPEDGFIPLGEIKELRRHALGAWEGTVDEVYTACRDSEMAGLSKAPAPSHAKHVDLEPPQYNTWISVMNIKQWEAVTDFLQQKNPINTVLHVKLEGFNSTTWGRVFGSDIPGIVKCISLPRPFRGEIKKRFIDEWKSFASGKDIDTDLFMANSMASIVFRDEFLADVPTVADENLYMTNERSEHFYKEMGVYRGPERAYGRIPVMTSAHLLMTGDITTPKGDRFMIIKPEAYDYRIVYTREPVTDRGGKRIDFTTENTDKVKEVLEKWL